MRIFFTGFRIRLDPDPQPCRLFMYSRLEYLRCRPGRGQMQAVLCLRSAWNAGVALPAQQQLKFTFLVTADMYFCFAPEENTSCGNIWGQRDRETTISSSADLSGSEESLSGKPNLYKGHKTLPMILVYMQSSRSTQLSSQLFCSDVNAKEKLPLSYVG